MMAKTAINCNTTFSRSDFKEKLIQFNHPLLNVFAFSELNPYDLISILADLATKDPILYSLTSMPNKKYPSGLTLTYQQTMKLVAHVLASKV
jgi:hypothetical protein